MERKLSPSPLLRLLLLPFCTAWFSTGAHASTPTTLPATRPTFPLMAWDYADDEKTLRDMAECGITCVAFVPPKALGLCQKYGLKAIVYDERISGSNWGVPYSNESLAKYLPDLVKEVGNHPAVMGYHVKDEPNAKEFPELAKSVALVKKLAPGKWPYVNLLPGVGPSWDTYLEDFIATCAPVALSYDRYSFYCEAGEIQPNFWSSLAQARAIARKHDLPLWNIVLTSPHWGYRDLTEADFRMQIYGSLVYGDRGIAFYKFCSKELPIIHAPDLGNFHDGPLNPFGERTPAWQWLHNCTRQVQNLAPFLLKLHSDDVYHVSPLLPARNHEPRPDDLVKSMSPGEFVIGDFTHEDGSRWVMIVNRSLTKPAKCVPTFNHPPKDLMYVSPITGELKKYPGGVYYLGPGQGVLMKLGT